jgi:hypothetical protein
MHLKGRGFVPGSGIATKKCPGTVWHGVRTDGPTNEEKRHYC